MFKKFLSYLAHNPWKSYATSIHANYIAGGFHSDRIVVKKEGFTIDISIGTNQRGNVGFRYTRFRCSYTSSSAPYFSMTNKQWKELISKNHAGSTPKQELFSLLSNDAQFFHFINNLSFFKYSSEKDDGEYGPTFLAHEHQLCLELEGEIEEHATLTRGIGTVLATLYLFRNNGLLSTEKSTVNY